MANQAETIYVRRVVQGQAPDFIPVGERSFPDPQRDPDYRVQLSTAQLDFGTGVSIQVSAAVHTDGTPEGRSKAFDQLVAEFRDNIERRTPDLRELLSAAYAQKGNGSQWNPSGKGTAQAAPAPLPPSAVVQKSATPIPGAPPPKVFGAVTPVVPGKRP